MGLLDFINTDESYEYISLKEAIILLKEKTNSTIQEVAIYLLNKGVPSDLACHIKGSDYKIKETSGKHFSYGMFRPYGRNWAFEYLTNISESYSCATWAELKNYNPLWEDWGIPLNNDNVALLEKTYWYRQAFLNLEPIKSLNLFDENLPELNPDLIPIWDENYLNILNADNPDSKETGFDTFVDDNFLYTTYDESNKPKKLPLYFKNNTFTQNQVDGLNNNLSTQETIGCGNPTIQQTEPTIENLNAEIARLKQEMVSKDQTIAELQQKNGSLVAENAINDIEISLKNSELLFIAVLLKKLQSAITTKRHKSQNAILQSIETEYGVGSGLSKSTTDKIMKKANGIYKSLITNKMQ
ncbi:MAG: hypothetical protein LWW88_14700 [Acinetobacter sp.]|uniref:hypothetical protein n=1 Tax=Acinetobacter sp. TaxID=472 RepID=UPI00259073C9|nr:hypothetical protein [Acinetobacter sp.]MCE1272770.1 hypothetical protein [Acinetobacter sp.]